MYVFCVDFVWVSYWYMYGFRADFVWIPSRQPVSSGTDTDYVTRHIREPQGPVSENSRYDHKYKSLRLFKIIINISDLFDNHSLCLEYSKGYNII